MIWFQGLPALVVLGLAAFAWMTEGGLTGTLFVTATALTVGALIAAASRRILFATAVTAAILSVLRTVSVVKQQNTDVILHAYDLVSLLNSTSTALSLWQDYRSQTVVLLVAGIAMIVLGWLAFRVDRTRVRRRHALAAAAIFASLAWTGAMSRGERTHMEFYYEDRYLATFFSTWAETIEALWRGSLIEAAAHAPGPRLTLPGGCELTGKPPHILLIHQESVAPPSHFPALRYDTTVDSFFRSHDGSLRKLRVPTYGGASWLTEFSLLTGVSADSLGGLRQFVQPIMRGKARDTLPHALARCGYRNVVFHPMLRSYLSIDKFFASVGMHQLVDARDQRAEQANERDRFYYSNVLAEIERHIKVSDRPLFTLVETMAAHGSYDYTYMPEVDVPGGGPGTPSRMHEYLRRLSMARMDYDEMRAELARRFPGEKFLIVHYGDHQPLATLPLLGFDENTSIETVMRSGNAAALVTYYAVDGVHYAPPPLPAFEMLDVAYLGAIILDAAGLPLSDVYRERKRLMTLCNGRYHDCPARGEILTFHRRLIDSGLMDAL